MRARLLACASLLAALACGGDGATSANGGKALVEFFNLSGTSLSISAGGFTDSEFPGRFCLNVDPSTPNVVMTATVSGARVTNFAPSFAPGGKYTVFIIDNPGGGVRFVTASSAFTPSAGKQGIRFFNAAGAAYDIHVSDTDVPAAGSTPVIRSVAPATASGYVSVAAGQHYFNATNAGTQTLAFGWGWRGYPAGQNSTLFVAPAAQIGSSLMPDCVAASTQPAS